MKPFLLCLTFLVVFSCRDSETKVKDTDKASTTMSAISSKPLTDFKVLDSEYINNSILWDNFNEALSDFTETRYEALKPLILEQDIPSLQNYIQTGNLSYEDLTKFYLYRIRRFDRENDLSLNAVISLNPHVISEAKQKDIDLMNKMRKRPIFGMPILLKDNINTMDMPTTSGAVAFQNNNTDDAFIVERLKDDGALILGKVNMSEWAYFFCGDCPSGYSAIGGQTLNPYGRKIMDTGGSSSGSGVAVAANFCVAAVGTETSGSILSPSSKNSGVGLKPTVGLLSRSGIVPISSTLDTPGPMAKNVTDTAILLDAMLGIDDKDPKSIDGNLKNTSYFESILERNGLEGSRFGVFKTMLDDSLYQKAIDDLKSKGAAIVEIEPEKIELTDFVRLLNLDMKKDFPNYIKTSGGSELTVTSVEDVMGFNRKDSLRTMPYGQKLFAGIVADSATKDEFRTLKETLKTNGKLFFDAPLQRERLDAIVSINNYHAGFAAVAEYPAITVPMGYTDSGEPKGLTFIARPLTEASLLSWAYAYEQVSKQRIAPENYN